MPVRFGGPPPGIQETGPFPLHPFISRISQPFFQRMKRGKTSDSSGSVRGSLSDKKIYSNNIGRFRESEGGGHGKRWSHGPFPGHDGGDPVWSRRLTFA